jgi:hypothetical protein
LTVVHTVDRVSSTCIYFFATTGSIINSLKCRIRKHEIRNFDRPVLVHTEFEFICGGSKIWGEWAYGRMGVWANRLLIYASLLIYTSLNL